MASSRGAGSRSLARGAATTTLAAAVSRITGFVRVVAVAAAMGTTFLANTYQTANTAPNVVFELVAAGVLTSIFVPTFVAYLVRDQRAEGWDAANALTSVALVGLVALAALIALLAPGIMWVLTLGVRSPSLRSQEMALGATFLRLFAPQVVFYGATMIMTAALQAHRRFWLSAIAPVFNNVVVIGVYLGYAALRAGEPPDVAGITTPETLLLGLGTTAGVIAMTASLIPRLVSLGWRWRWRFDIHHPAVRRGARLGIWALSYAGGYQAGLIVVLVLANRVEGGVAAYQWAYTFFYLPHALFSMPIFNVLFTAMSEHVARDEIKGVLERLRDGLAMLGFILAPVAAFMLALFGPLAHLTLQYGVMTSAGASLVGRVIAAFVIGLPTYSAFLVFTRAFYAIGDTKTPALVNMATVAAASVIGALLFFLLPAGWEVPGLALGHSLAFAGGSIALGHAFGKHTDRVPNRAFAGSMARSGAVALAALAAMLLVHSALPETGRLGALVNLAGGGLAGAVVYTGAMFYLKAPELGRIVALLRPRSAA